MRNVKSFLLFLLLFTGAVWGNAQTSAQYASMIRLKKGFKVYQFPNTFKLKITSFSVMDPGLSLVPLNGGIFIPGAGSWLIDPQLQSPILASSFVLTDKDTSLLLMRLDRKRNKILIQKSTYIDSAEAAITLFSMPVNKYDFRAVGSRHFFLWGAIEGGSALWRSDYTNVSSVFYTGSLIKDMDYINDNNYVLAVDSSVVGVGMKKKPEVLFQFDAPVESVAVDRHLSGAVYVSTKAGVVRMNSMEEDDIDIITEGIHGKLQIFQNKLFILWSEKNQVVEIMLK